MVQFRSLLAALLLAAPLAAQDGRPYAFLSSSPKEPTQGPPLKAVPSLRLRPNNELPYYAYVRNPGTDTWEKLTVVLASDEKGENVLAEGSIASLAAGETLKVKLAAKAVAVVEKPADPKVVDGKPVAAAVVAPVASPLPEAVYLLLMRATDDNPRTLVKSESAKPLLGVRIASPKEYLSISTATPAGVTASNNDLYVQIGDKDPSDPFRGKPCKVVLNVRPDLIEGLDTSAPRDGTFEAVVAPGADKVTLVAKGLKFTDDNRKGFISITADGYSNAFVYQVDFRGTSPKPVEDRGFLRIDTPRYALTGKPLAAKLELFGDDPTGLPRLLFYRTAVGSPESVTADLTTPRDSRTGYRVGPDGELIVGSIVKDWDAVIDTAGLYGQRKLKFIIEKSDRPFAPDELTVTFDDTPPINVEFIKPPLAVVKGKKFKVVARASDPESGLVRRKVLFYLGDPPAEGKKPLPGTTAIGQFRLDGSYMAEFDVPDVKGTFEVGVRFTNNVGLSSEKSIEVIATEPPPKPTTGKIEGRVIQGDDRGQPGLTVELKDGDGKKLDTATTDEKGTFKFNDLKPGDYGVSSMKSIDYYAKGDAKAKVVAGETAKPVISLKR